MDSTILQHVAEAYRHLLAAEARYQCLSSSLRSSSSARRACLGLPPERERKLLDDATTLVGNFMASPHSER